MDTVTVQTDGYPQHTPDRQLGVTPPPTMDTSEIPTVEQVLSGLKYMFS